MANFLFYLIVGIIAFDYVLDRFLEYLNSTYWTNELPEELSGIYDSEKYEKFLNYEKTKHRFSLFTDSFSLILMLLMLFLSGFAYVDSIAQSYSENPIIIALIFFGIIAFGSDLMSTPFSLYSTFVIEEKFGFNKTTKKTFVLDKIKGWILGGIIGGLLMAFIIWIYQVSGNLFWVYAWSAVSVFSLFMMFFYSTLIVPMFNKQTPLEEGELRNAIEEYAKKVGFNLKNIFVIDGSKRSTKANAYFTGFGSQKRIVLYDTLIKDHSTEELVAVLAHEVGHYKKHHTIYGMIISIIQTGFVFFILSLFIDNPELSKALGTTKPSFHIGILAFGLLYSPISLISGLLMSIISRKHEYQADQFAKGTYGFIHLKSALIKLSANNLSNLNPHPWYVFIHYSHPTLLQRIKAMESNK
ncbi:MAG: M48 family metallopeptidase [Bacteroidetes bacterium]|nr:M48 family metallopeptidase [Bacteroidota bacterium]